MLYYFIPLKDKNVITVTKAFQEVLDESYRKPIKIWVDKGSEIYSSSMKSWLEENDIEMYSTLNDGKSFAAERFIKTLKKKDFNEKIHTIHTNNTYNTYIHTSNTHHNTIKIKPADVKSCNIFNSTKKIMRKILNLKCLIM